MRATAKYFWVVMALFVGQVLLGIVTAHYQVEGQGLYGLPFAEWLPYAITRTWHTQLAVLWIAVAWLAAGLYVAPLLSGHEPRFQRLGVNFLFGSLLGAAFGAFAGYVIYTAVDMLMEPMIFFRSPSSIDEFNGKGRGKATVPALQAVGFRNLRSPLDSGYVTWSVRSSPIWNFGVGRFAGEKFGNGDRPQIFLRLCVSRPPGLKSQPRGR